MIAGSTVFVGVFDATTSVALEVAVAGEPKPFDAVTATLSFLPTSAPAGM